MENITLTVGKETTEAEKAEIIDAFSAFNVTLNANTIRLHEGALPLAIGIVAGSIMTNIASNLLWEALLSLREKLGVSIHRKTSVQLVYKQRQLVISKDNILLLDERIEFETLEEATQYIDAQ